MTRYNIILTIMLIVCIVAIGADTDNNLIFFLTKVVGVAVGYAAYQLHEYWASQGKVKPFNED